jgi:tetratricopeptide (TPR) repeat protein
MGRRAAIVMGLLLGLMGSPLVPSPGRFARADDELDRHLADLRQQAEDPTTSIARREVLVLELAATLDRTGQSTGAIDSRRVRWTEAIQLLDRFEMQNPGHPRARETQFQAAVYVWALGRSWQQQAALDPTNQTARSEAVKYLDAAFVRLRAIQETLQPGDGELLAQNVRYRIAQTLADRAELDPEGSPGRKRLVDDALAALDRGISEPSLRGFAQLLRADLLGRQERFDQAEEALASAAKAKPAPPPADLLEVRVEILAGRKRFDEAISAIDAAAIEPAMKDALAVRLLLSQRAGTASGAERSAAESALFRRVETLRASSAPGARAVLLELARRLVEPDARQGPEAWEAVAEGAIALGEVTRASRLESRGAARAEELGRPEDAAKLRLRAGAYLYQAELYGEADVVLTQVFDNPKAGSARSGAGMLRAMARGRALAVGRPGATMKGYVDALEAQIRQFPSDPATNEARWLLGRVRLASSEKDAAMALWSAITPGAPRWVDARLAIARNNQRELDILRIGNDRAQIDARYAEARKFLTESLELAPSAFDKAELTLAMARLELTPIVGTPDQARQRCEELLHASTRSDQRDRARRLNIVALAELNRFDEAETKAREESIRSHPVDLLEPARLLDHVVSDSESDLRIRRFGLIIRTLLAKDPQSAKELSEEQMAELQLRRCRALLFRGDEEGARRSLTAWNGHVPDDDHGFLKDLGDTYFRLQAYVLAIDVERLRQQRLSSGSLPWFESRYRLALAEHWAGKNRDALHLIDATSILHPDLGGGELREKFIRLRQKIGPEQ